jgi:hypothetical protein
MAVERAAARVCQVEIGIEQALAEERRARSRRNAALADAGTQPDSWLKAESEAQIQRVLAVRNARALPALEKEAGAAREQYLERRRERQKLEQLLTNAAEEERMEVQRKTRAAMEDLFQGRRWYESRATSGEDKIRLIP